MTTLESRLAEANRKRADLKADYARLKPHSRRRAELGRRLAEITTEALRLEIAIRRRDARAARAAKGPAAIAQPTLFDGVAA